MRIMKRWFWTMRARRARVHALRVFGRIFSPLRHWRQRREVADAKLMAGAKRGLMLRDHSLILQQRATEEAMSSESWLTRKPFHH